MWLRFRESLTTWLSLMTTTGTLLCCALPVMLVSLGFGAAVAGLTSELPWLIGLSRHKEWIFAVSAIMLALAGWLIRRPGRTCPVDPVLAERCDRLDRWNRRIWWTGIVLWSMGLFVAYLALPLRKLFE